MDAQQAIDQLRQLFPQLPEIALAILAAAQSAQHQAAAAATAAAADETPSAAPAPAPAPTPAAEPPTPKPKPANPTRHFAICDSCRRGLVGIRYKCVNCVDYDLCAECEETNADGSIHSAEHAFLKLRAPLARQWRRREPLIAESLIAPSCSNATAAAAAPATPNVHHCARRGPVHCSRVRPILVQPSAPPAQPADRLEQLSNQLEALAREVAAIKNSAAAAPATPEQPVPAPEQPAPMPFTYCRPHPMMMRRGPLGLWHPLFHAASDLASSEPADAAPEPESPASVQEPEREREPEPEPSQLYPTADASLSTSGAAVPAPEEPFEFEEQLYALVSMGLSEDNARATLISTNGNLEEACELLFAE